MKLYIKYVLYPVLVGLLLELLHMSVGNGKNVVWKQDSTIVKSSLFIANPVNLDIAAGLM